MLSIFSSYFCYSAFFSLFKLYFLVGSFWGILVRQDYTLLIRIYFSFWGEGREMKIMGAFIRDLTLFYLLSMNRISLVIMMKLSSYPLDLSEEKLIH